MILFENFPIRGLSPRTLTRFNRKRTLINVNCTGEILFACICVYSRFFLIRRRVFVIRIFCLSAQPPKTPRPTTIARAATTKQYQLNHFSSAALTKWIIHVHANRPVTNAATKPMSNGKA